MRVFMFIGFITAAIFIAASCSSSSEAEPISSKPAAEPLAASQTDTSVSNVDLSYRALKTSTDAETLMRDLVGIPATLKTVKTTLRDFVVPGLMSTLNGRQVWHTQLSEARVKVTVGETEKVNPYINGFDVYTDDRGALVLMRSIPKNAGLELKPPLPDASKARAEMDATANRYLGLPSEPPKLTVRELLNKARQQGFAPIDMAKEIRVKRVIQSRESVGEGPTAVWVITLRGIPPYPGKGPGAVVSDEERSHLRLVYNDDGKLMFADNLMY